MTPVVDVPRRYLGTGFAYRTADGSNNVSSLTGEAFPTREWQLMKDRMSPYLG
jgi:hypothetical protein